MAYVLAVLGVFLLFVFGTHENNDVLKTHLLRQIRDRLDELKHLRIKSKCPTTSPPKPGTGGAIYVRWGRTTCPEETVIVYKGQIGGSHCRHTGAAVNYLCMPSNPNWDKYNDATSSHAYVYGTEYATHQQNVPGSNVDHKYDGHDAPCVVCRSTKRTTFLMVPGRNLCDDGWHLEYKGYLMAGRNIHAAGTEYICVDRNPEIMHGGVAKHWQTTLFSVEAQCGSLRCPPYVNGRELTCSVCTL